jgi:hypothetical protein
MSNSLLEKPEGKCQIDFLEVVVIGGDESLGHTSIYCVKEVRQQIAQFFNTISVYCHIYMHLIYLSQICFKAETEIYYYQFFINMYVVFSLLCKLLPVLEITSAFNQSGSILPLLVAQRLESANRALSFNINHSSDSCFRNFNH